MEARPSKRRKKMMMKKTTKSLIAELEDLPVEVLVKIFNYLSNRDIRCGISLVCKRFQEICQDESLVPVKDLCIYGQPMGPESKDKQQFYGLENIGAVFDVMSKNLTSLKIKALNPEAVGQLVSIALQSCPKLVHLEIIETNKQLGKYFWTCKSMNSKRHRSTTHMSYLCKIPGLGFNYQLMDTIKEHGRDLRSLNLLIVGRDDTSIDFNTPMIDYIIEGCPNLKTLTLESLRGWKKFEPDELMSKFLNDLMSKSSDIAITEENLKDLYNSCKELKDLKLTNVIFEEIDTEDEVKKILPNCNFDIKECYFDGDNIIKIGLYFECVFAHAN